MLKSPNSTHSERVVLSEALVAIDEVLGTRDYATASVELQ